MGRAFLESNIQRRYQSHERTLLQDKIIVKFKMDWKLDGKELVNKKSK